MVATAPQQSRGSVWGRLPVVWHLRRSSGLQRWMLVAGLVLIGGFILVALFVPLIAPHSYADMSSAAGPFPRHGAPSADHPWGTTVGGYDVLSRTLWGARTALLTVLMAISASLVIGVCAGLVSGYLGGPLDRVLVMVADAIYAFPSLLLAIVVSIVISGGQSSYFGGMLSAAIAISVVFVPQYFRAVRAETLQVKAEPFVEAARVFGMPRTRILRRHVLRNTTRSIPLLVTLNAAEAILTLAALGFLGFGIDPTAAAEWGYDLNRAITDTASGIWWTGVFPGSAIVLLVLGITLVGESLNDIADPRLRRRVRRRKDKVHG